jgi:hypothetical protein
VFERSGQIRRHVVSTISSPQLTLWMSTPDPHPRIQSRSTSCSPISSSSLPSRFSNLPLSLLPSLELLQNANNLLQARKPGIELLVDAFLVVTEVLVESSAVRRGAHGGGEDGLDHEGVVGLEGVAVGGAEGLGELGSRVGEVGAEALGCEVEGSVERLVSLWSLVG